MLRQLEVNMSAVSDLYTLVEQIRHLITANALAVEVFVQNDVAVPNGLLLKGLIANLEKAIEKAVT
jgi:hypothetical protein